MDPLEKRVKERMTFETRELRAAQMRLGKRRQALAKDADKAQGAVKKWFGALGEGEKPTKAVVDAGSKALRTLTKGARDLTKISDEMAMNAAALAKLESTAEFDRRMKHAKDLGVEDKPMSGVEAAELVLVRHGKAMHITDLTREVLETGVVRLTGKTPEQTMSAYLAKASGKTDGKFVRVAPGVFDVRKREPAAA